MPMNDRQVERMKELWAKGMSASEIAAELGDGITRNSVIGKVHRLGLSRFVKKRTIGNDFLDSRGYVRWNAELDELVASMAQNGAGYDAIRRALEARIGASIGKDAVQNRLTYLKVRVNRPAPKRPRRRPIMQAILAVEPETVQEAEPELIEADVVTLFERVTILELRAGLCHWPLGDPRTPEFRYCGSPCDLTDSYCRAHKRIAYVPPVKKPAPPHPRQFGTTRRTA